MQGMKIEMDIIADIKECLRKIKLCGEQPRYAMMSQQITRFKNQRKGTSKQRKAARFYNKKRLAYLREKTGLDIFIVRR